MRRQRSFVLSALILLSALISIFTVGCSNTPAHVTVGLPMVFDYEDERIEDGILIKITTNKSTYQPGENVYVVVYVENQSPQTIVYTYSSAHIYLYVFSTVIGTATIGQNGQKSSNVENAIARPGELRAGESITLDTFWDQKVFGSDGEEIAATPGLCHLVASFVGRPGVVVGTTIQID